MTGVLAGAGAPRRVTPAIEKRVEDRWLVVPVRRVSLAMSGVVLASLMIHAGLLLFATRGETPKAARPEISVELVQEPKPEPKSTPKPEAKPDVKSPEAPSAAAAPKAETPKAEEAKADAVPPALPEQEPATPEPKQVEPKQVESKQAKPKQVEPKPAAEPPIDDKRAEHEAAVKDLQQELETLKAEQAALETEQRAAAQSAPPPPAASPPAMLADPKIGGIPPSFAAVALPGLSEIDGIATGYQELVFSQLAKAKGVRRHMGVPGTAGVVFSVDGAGRLVKASIAHPSGSDALDKEAIDIVNAAGPFPKPPPGSDRTFSANFNFVPQAAP